MNADWVNDAACRSQPAELFFPDSENPTEQEYRAAQNICATCAHRKPCLRVALNFETPDVRRFGVWGGLTPRQRARLMGD